MSFEWPSYKQQPVQVTYLPFVQFNTNVEDGRYKHSGSYSILKEQRGEELHVRQRFWTENLALISIMVPSGVFLITFLLMLTAASSS